MSQDWELKRLFEVCDIKTGKKDVNQGNPNGQYPFFTCAKEHGFSDTYSFDTEALLIAGNGDVGNVSYFLGKFEAYQRTYVLYNFRAVLPKFLFLLLDGTLKKYLSDKTLGNTIPYIKLGVLRDFEFSLPPLTEQQRIVSILDEAFAAIDQAKANTERNLKNAKELFDSYLEEVFDKGAAGWEKRTLGEVASFSQGIQIGLEHHKTEPKEGYVRFIRIVDYTQNTDDIRYVPDPGHKYFVNEDDIIMVRYGTPGLIGRGKAGVIANNLFKITIQRDDILNDFLSLCLSQKRIRNFLSAQGSSTMPALNFGQLKTVMVNFPSLSAQHTIVRQLDALRAETQRIEALYQKKLVDLDELKKSILQKAFTGELTTA